MPPKENNNYQEQEAILRNLFTHFSYFAFDKAKDLADKERDAFKNIGSPVWISLLSSVSQLALIDKSYMNLSFLVPKGFLRKESSLRLTYETLLTDLAEIEKKYPNQSITSPTSGISSNSGSKQMSKTKPERVLIHLSQHLVLYVQARLLMLSFYEKLVTLSSEKEFALDEAIENISEIIKKNIAGFQHPVLAPIRTLFNHECDIVKNLLESLKAMQDWEFLSSLLHLHDAHLKLLEWQTIVQPKESKKYSFAASFLKSSPLPSLYQWFWKAKSTFVSKFSLYFYEPLSSQTTNADMKNMLARQNIDYMAKIQAFHKKSDASSVCIVLETTGLNIYRGIGYHHPSQERRQDPSRPYPVLFAYPTKSQDYSKVISRLSAEKNSDFASKDHVFHYFDLKTGSTFLLKIESNIILVTSFETKKSEKDTLPINDFMMDLVTHLRCTKTFSSLKPK